MVVAPLGSFSTPVVALADMVADSTVYAAEAIVGQGITDAYDSGDPDHVAAVKASIHYECNEEELNGHALRRPFAVIASRPIKSRTGISVCYEMVTQAEMILVLSRAATYLDDPKDSYIDFANFVGQVIDYVGSQAGKGTGELAFPSISVARDAMRVSFDDRDEQGVYDFWDIHLQIEAAP